MAEADQDNDVANLWRRQTPGHDGWSRTARADDPDKFFIASADGHVQEPSDLWKVRMDSRFHDRLPGVVLDGKGGAMQKTEGFRPLRIRNIPFQGEDMLRNRSGRTPEERLTDLAMDGVDAEILFPNKGLTIWATPDPSFSLAMCRAWNDWAWETFGPYNDRLAPMACVAPGDLNGTIAEIQRAAKLGFRGLSLPCKPVWGAPDHEAPNYNLPEFDPMWACIQDVDLPITFHVSTGRDPRTARGNGGAVINYAVHSLAPTMEPIANLCASGVLDRFPKLIFGTIEAGIGWVAWALAAMDEAVRKHHMWARPKLKQLPSDYFRQNGFASFQEDQPGLDLAREYGFTHNFLWANDYPHHEGTWPHSAAAIERTMGRLDDGERARILGLNTARIFRLPIPARYLTQADAAAVERARTG
ncbi:MAG: amidohydrolase [Pseudomonadales bacterium]|nr:amidohydrolase [Pseudomonadales bacterium]MCP5185842.1 amidohydrolase [Pseudomonadales bacterium]